MAASASPYLDAAAYHPYRHALSGVLLQVLSEKKIGIVAHFYMDPEVQGVLSQAGERWPHIGISDSLLMADRAVKMAEQGCKAVAVLGVDFMSENVRAILDEAGHRDVQVCLASNPACCTHVRVIEVYSCEGHRLCDFMQSIVAGFAAV